MATNPLFPYPIDHIGIAVQNLEEAEKKYQELWQTACFHKEVLPHQQVKVGFIQTDSVKIELIESLTEDGPIGKFIQKKGPGMHHIAYRVKDIHGELKRLQDLNFRLIDTIPRKGAMGKWVAFIHPKEVHGVLIEICQPMDQEDE